MTPFLNFQTKILTSFLLAVMIILSLGSCNQKKDKSETSTIENKTSVDTAKQQPPVATPVEPTTKVETEPLKPPAPKICEPNFNLIASPKKNQKIYYVSGFNPVEFKCWELLEKQALKVCAESPGIVYFVDNAKIAVTTTPPHYLDANTLKTYGIGMFTFNGKEWIMDGSNKWGRKDKGYGYYNTNGGGGG